MGVTVVFYAFGRSTGFTAQSPRNYANKTPVFDIREQLTGDMICEGIIYGTCGRVNSRFVATMRAEWDGDTCRMTEHFTYDSGTKQDREWTLQVLPDGKSIANAPDLRGQGSGQQAGSAVQLKYTIELPASAGGYVLNVVDWLYVLDNGSIMNRSQFRKFGIKVAEMVATIRPTDSGGTPHGG